MPNPGDLLVSANNFFDELIELRRKLHQNPEFALDLPTTQKTLLAHLEGLGEITLGKISEFNCPGYSRWQPRPNGFCCGQTWTHCT